MRWPTETRDLRNSGSAKGLVTLLVTIAVFFMAGNIMAEEPNPRPQMLDPNDTSSYIRDRDSLLAASRKAEEGSVIAYTPLEFLNYQTGLVVIFPPDAPTGPSKAQIAALEYLMANYGEDMELNIIRAAFEHYIEEADPAETDGEFGEVFGRWGGTIATPAFIQIIPEETDGVAHTHFGFFLQREPPQRYRIKMHRDKILEVTSETSQPRPYVPEDGQ